MYSILFTYFMQILYMYEIANIIFIIMYASYDIFLILPFSFKNKKSYDFLYVLFIIIINFFTNYNDVSDESIFIVIIVYIYIIQYNIEYMCLSAPCTWANRPLFDIWQNR
jgi:hypothetical protein